MADEDKSIFLIITGDKTNIIAYNLPESSLIVNALEKVLSECSFSSQESKYTVNNQNIN